MQRLDIEQTENAPKIILDYENGFIELEGKCYPENTFEFFEPIVEWLTEYFKNNTDKSTTVNIKLTYFNSATTQSLFDIFDILQESEHTDLDINWYYEVNNKNALRDYEDYSEEFEELNIKAVPNNE